MMNHVAHVVRSLFGREGAPFETQVELSRKAGIQPSTLNGVLKAKRVEPETLGKILDCVGTKVQEELLAAAVRDAVPESHVALLFAPNGKVEVKDGGESLSPLAERYLAWLRTQARRDPQALASLEMQARWVGLDKV